MIAQHAPTHLVKVGHEFNLTISSAEKVLKEARTPKNQYFGPSKSSLYWQKSKPSIILENFKCLDVVVCTSEGNVGRRL